MYIQKLKYIFVLSVFCVTAFQCEKPEEYPIEPAVTFNSLVKFTNGSTGKDTAALLAFSFTDGDGDIGLNESDTTPPFNPGSEYYNNLFMKYFEKKNNIWTEVVLPLPYNFRVPYITPTGSNKALSGDIYIDLFLPPSKTNLPIRFELYFVDRALQKSNVITTDELVVTTQ
jgi:hypothetical protein